MVSAGTTARIPGARAASPSLLLFILVWLGLSRFSGGGRRWCFRLSLFRLWRRLPLRLLRLRPIRLCRGRDGPIFSHRLLLAGRRLNRPIDCSGRRRSRRLHYVGRRRILLPAVDVGRRGILLRGVDVDRRRIRPGDGRRPTAALPSSGVRGRLIRPGVGRGRRRSVGPLLYDWRLRLRLRFLYWRPIGLCRRNGPVSPRRLLLAGRRLTRPVDCSGRRSSRLLHYAGRRRILLLAIAARRRRILLTRVDVRRRRIRPGDGS